MIFTFPRLQAFNDNGILMSGAKLYFYESGTSTDKTVYTNAGLSIAHTQPVIADASGLFAAIYTTGDYRVTLKSATDVPLWGPEEILNQNDAEQHTYLAPYYGSVSRTVESKLSDVINVKDFGATGDGFTDDTATLQSAINAAAGKILLWESGNYLITAALTISTPLRIMATDYFTTAPNYGTRLFTETAGINLINLAITAGGGNESFGGSIEGLLLDGNSKASIGLNISGANTVKWSFHNLNIINCTHLGTYITANHSFRFYTCQWALNGITSNLVTDGGIQINGANAISFFGCNLEANYGSGLRVTDGYSNEWRGGAIEANQYHGIIGDNIGQHFTITNADFELNNQASAVDIYDIYISTGTNSYWSISDLKFSGTDTAASIRTNAPQTYIRNVRGEPGRTVLWTAGAYAGLLEIALELIDPASVMDNTVSASFTRVVNTLNEGMAITTPAVPATTVQQVNLLFQTVAIYITSVGTTTDWSIIDGAQRTQAMGSAVTSGLLCILPPGHGIKITYSSPPTWRWQSI